MHRSMRDDLEKVLAGETDSVRHAVECGECREEIAAMREQARWLRGLRAPDSEMGPRAGFYARIIDRIEAQSPSIWSLFFESQFGRGLALASMAVALCLGVYLVTSERASEQATASAAIENVSPPTVMMAGVPDQNAVFVNLITYPEQ